MPRSLHLLRLTCTLVPAIKSPPGHKAPAWQEPVWWGQLQPVEPDAPWHARPCRPSSPHRAARACMTRARVMRPAAACGTCCHAMLCSLLFSRSVASDSLGPHEPQHARLPCPSPSPGVVALRTPWTVWKGSVLGWAQINPTVIVHCF